MSLRDGLGWAGLWKGPCLFWEVFRMLRFWKSMLAVHDCLQLGRRNERVPVSLGSVAKVKPCPADLGSRPPLGLGRTLALKGSEV